MLEPRPVGKLHHVNTCRAGAKVTPLPLLMESSGLELGAITDFNRVLHSPAGVEPLNNERHPPMSQQQAFPRQDKSLPYAFEYAAYFFFNQDLGGFELSGLIVPLELRAQGQLTPRCVERPTIRTAKVILGT